MYTLVTSAGGFGYYAEFVGILIIRITHEHGLNITGIGGLLQCENVFGPYPNSIYTYSDILSLRIVLIFFY